MSGLTPLVAIYAPSCYVTRSLRSSAITTATAAMAAASARRIVCPSEAGCHGIGPRVILPITCSKGIPWVDVNYDTIRFHQRFFMVTLPLIIAGSALYGVAVFDDVSICKDVIRRVV